MTIQQAVRETVRMETFPPLALMPPPAEDLPDAGRSLDTAALVEAARRAQPTAFDSLVERYQPLVASVTGRYHLTSADAEDIAQLLWLRLLSHLGNLREPLAVPGWIRTTTRHLCLDLLAAQARVIPFAWDGDDHNGGDLSRSLPSLTADPPRLDDGLLARERQAAVRQGLKELTDREQQLLMMLVADPPLPYREISRRLGLPIGSIGPTRARCLEKLRASAAVRALGLQGRQRRRGSRRSRTNGEHQARPIAALCLATPDLQDERR